MNFNFFNFEFESQTTVKLTNILDKIFWTDCSIAVLAVNLFQQFYFLLKLALKVAQPN